MPRLLATDYRCADGEAEKLKAKSISCLAVCTGNIFMTKQQIEACRIVENLLRSLGGKNVQVCIMPDIVSVAPVEWAGDSTGNTLAEAMEDALKHDEG
jgi:hypothetical protein